MDRKKQNRHLSKRLLQLFGEEAVRTLSQAVVLRLDRTERLDRRTLTSVFLNTSSSGVQAKERDTPRIQELDYKRLQGFLGGVSERFKG